MTRPLPPSASIATPLEGAKLCAPAAERNVAALTDLLGAHAPQTGRALEIASGTGQHIVHFAKALPGLHWHPTDVEAKRLASINAFADGTANIAPARHLNATEAGWAAKVGPFDLIFLSNLLHLITTPEAQAVIHEVARALRSGGPFILYGPFKRGGKLTSAGDEKFHAELRGADPDIGYKDDADIAQWLSAANLNLHDRIEMPANNLAFIAGRAI